MPSGSPQSTAVTAVRKRPRHTKRQLQEWRQGYVFLLPAVIILGIFIGISALFVIYLSFCKVNLFTNSYTFVKLDNYLRLFTDEYARTALLNSLKFSVVVVPCQTIIALIIASVLNSRIRGKTFFRAVYFLPTLTSSSALTIIFMFMFSVTGPITTYVLLTGIIGTLQMFDQAYIFSNGSGGPANSTLTVSLMVYRYAFGTTNAMGYASTIAIVLALVIMAVSLIAEKLNDAEKWY